MGSRHIAALDGLRGLAVLTVVIHNSSWIERDTPYHLVNLVIALTATGWVGVSLFFVLSGALITGILLDSRESPGYFRTFYARRTLRIFPLYYALLALVFFVGPHVVRSEAWRQSVHTSAIWYWTYLSNWIETGILGIPHLWSLAVEEQFYLVWPVVVWLLSGRRLMAFCIALIVSAPIARLVLPRIGFPEDAAYLFTISRWDALAIGAAVAMLSRDVAGRAWLRRNAPRVGAVSLCALVAFIGLHHGLHHGDPLVDVVGQSIVAVLFGGLIGAILAPEGRVGAFLHRVFGARWLRFLGKYSYAIYIFHVPLHHAAEIYVADWVNVGGVGERILRLAAYDAGILAASTVLALISWNLLEKHFLRLKDRLAPTPTGKRPQSQEILPFPGASAA